MRKYLVHTNNHTHGTIVSDDKIIQYMESNLGQTFHIQEIKDWEPKLEKEVEVVLKNDNTHTFKMPEPLSSLSDDEIDKMDNEGNIII